MRVEKRFEMGIEMPVQINQHFKNFAARTLAGCVLAAALLGTAVPAQAADQYDPGEAGHPLRIAAYVVHPMGVVLDYLIMRPAYWVGSQEPWRTLFGRTD